MYQAKYWGTEKEDKNDGRGKKDVLERKGWVNQ